MISVNVSVIHNNALEFYRVNTCMLRPAAAVCVAYAVDDYSQGAIIDRRGQ